MISTNDSISSDSGSTGSSGQFTAPDSNGHQPSSENAPTYPSQNKSVPAALLLIGIAFILLIGGGAAFLLISGKGIGFLTKDRRSQDIPVSAENMTNSGNNIVTIGRFTLNGIIYSKSTPVAIINGRSCRRGETIDGAQVKSIDSDTVVMTANDQDYTLRLQ
jgi:hypothetical protein